MFATMPSKKPAKILLITPYFLDSFPQKLSMGSAVKQAIALSKKYQVLVLTTGRQRKVEKFNRNLTVKSIDAFLLPDPINYVLVPKIFSEFLRVRKSFKPDFVLVSKFMFFTSLIIPLARVLGDKVITTTDTFPGINWFPRSPLVGAVMWLYARIIGLPLLWLSNKVILLYSGLEPTARKYHLNFLTIPNGVDPKMLGKLPPPKNINKLKGEFWVGFVGRPESVKGYDLALKTAKHFERNPDIRFVFAGGNTKPYQAENRIYLGFRSDIANIYQLFDCLILPSYAEGLPNVLLEAMSQGVPCVATRVGGIPSLLRHNYNGLLTSPGSFSQLISQINRLMADKNLRQKISISAKETVTTSYNWQDIIGKYAEILT